jgi:hypothetical protein
VRGEAERTWFISALTAAASASTSRARVVLGVRVDFYGHCGQYPQLVDALHDAQGLVGPMTLTSSGRLSPSRPRAVAAGLKPRWSLG